MPLQAGKPMQTASCGSKDIEAAATMKRWCRLTAKPGPLSERPGALHLVGVSSSEHLPAVLKP